MADLSMNSLILQLVRQCKEFQLECYAYRQMMSEVQAERPQIVSPMSQKFSSLREEIRDDVDAQYFDLENTLEAGSDCRAALQSFLKQ